MDKKKKKKKKREKVEAEKAAVGPGGPTSSRRRRPSQVKRLAKKIAGLKAELAEVEGKKEADEGKGERVVGMLGDYKVTV